MALLWSGVVIVPRGRRIVGAFGVVPTVVSLLGASAIVPAVTGVTDSLGEAAGIALLAVVFAAGWSCSGFRIDEHGVSPHRFPLSRHQSRVAWGRVHRIEVTHMRRISGVLKVDYGPPTSPAVRALDAAMLGTIGVLRYTQPLRIIASAAELGLLPPGLPVRMYGRPMLPSTRAAFRRLERHHDRVEVVRAAART